MVDINPRFPHALKVYRARRTATGEIDVDAEGDAIYDPVTLHLVATMDGIPCRDSNGAFITTDVTSVACGLRQSSRNTSEMGDVVIRNTCIHTPLFIGELYYDDILEITDYDKTYKARLVRKEAHNFGCNIWIDEIRN